MSGAPGWVTPLPSYGTTIYASASGGDSAAGTFGDPASVTRAQTLARAAVASGSRPHVVLRGGTYTLTATLALTSLDNGSVWESYPGETAILSGGTDLTTGWTVDAGSVYKRTWNGHTRQLWTNVGTRATRSRSAAQSGWTVSGVNPITAPDSTVAGFAHPEDVELVRVSNWQFYRVRVASASGTSVTVNANDWTDSQLALSAWNVFDGVDWYENARELVTQAGYWYHNRHTNTLYYWPRAGETMNTTPIVAGNLECVVSITGTLDAPAVGIEFRNVQIAYATWVDPDSNGYSAFLSGTLIRGGSFASMVRVPSAVRLYAAKSCIFENCALTHLGASGISLEYGSQNCAIRNCTITDLSATGVCIGNVVNLATDPFPTDSRATLSYNSVRNNSITQCGLEYLDAPGIWLGHTDHSLIDFNTIDHVGYDGITSGFGQGQNDAAYAGGGGTGFPPGVAPVPPTNATTCCGSNTFSKNRITNFGQGCKDVGGIYLNSAMPGTVVSGNSIDATSARAPAISFYLDQGCSGVTCSGNVAESTATYAFFAQPGTFGGATQAHGNTLSGNYATSENNAANSGSTRVHSDNTESGYSVGSLSAAALAIKANAGRQ